MARLRFGAFTAFVTLASLLGTTGSAVSQEPHSSPLPTYLPLKKEACFGRVYEAKHLAQNPKQRVTSFHVAR